MCKSNGHEINPNSQKYIEMRVKSFVFRRRILRKQTSKVKNITDKTKPKSDYVYRISLNP